MNNLSEYLNTHKPLNYTRTVGKRPITVPVNSEHLVDVQTLVRAFGPPEREPRKQSTLVFWNFTRNKGVGVFTLSARVNNWNRTVAARRSIWLAGCMNPERLAAEKGSLDFYVWVNDRIGAVDNGDEAPLFLGSGAFAITRVGR